jgi:hypothetical protein
VRRETLGGVTASINCNERSDQGIHSFIVLAEVRAAGSSFACVYALQTLLQWIFGAVFTTRRLLNVKAHCSCSYTFRAEAATAHRHTVTCCRRRRLSSCAADAAEELTGGSRAQTKQNFRSNPASVQKCVLHNDWVKPPF